MQVVLTSCITHTKQHPVFFIFQKNTIPKVFLKGINQDALYNVVEKGKYFGQASKNGHSDEFSNGS